MAEIAQAAEQLIQSEVISPVPSVRSRMSDVRRSMIALCLTAGEAPKGTGPVNKESLQTFDAHSKRFPKESFPKQSESWFDQVRTFAGVDGAGLKTDQLFYIALNFSPAIRDDKKGTIAKLKKMPPEELIPNAYKGLVLMAEHQEIDRWCSEMNAFIDKDVVEQWDAADASGRETLRNKTLKLLEKGLHTAFTDFIAKDPGRFAPLLLRLHDTIRAAAQPFADTLTASDASAAARLLRGVAYRGAWMLLLHTDMATPEVEKRADLSVRLHRALTPTTHVKKKEEPQPKPAPELLSDLTDEEKVLLEKWPSNVDQAITRFGNAITTFRTNHWAGDFRSMLIHEFGEGFLLDEELKRLEDHMPAVKAYPSEVLPPDVLTDLQTLFSSIIPAKMIERAVAFIAARRAKGKPPPVPVPIPKPPSKHDKHDKKDHDHHHDHMNGAHHHGEGHHEHVHDQGPSIFTPKHEATVQSTRQAMEQAGFANPNLVLRYFGGESTGEDAHGHGEAKHGEDHGHDTSTKQKESPFGAGSPHPGLYLRYFGGSAEEKERHGEQHVEKKDAKKDEAPKVEKTAEIKKEEKKTGKKAA